MIENKIPCPCSKTLALLKFSLHPFVILSTLSRPKRYVKLHFSPTKSFSEANNEMMKHIESEDPPEFVESLAFSPTKAVVMTGNMVDNCGTS